MSMRGPNESGKTTVQRALELVLTRRATSTAAELEGLRPWDAPPTSRSTVSIEFEQDDEDGRKTGTVEKTFAESEETARSGPGKKLHVTYDIARQFPGYGEKAGAPSSEFADRVIHHLA